MPEPPFTNPRGRTATGWSTKNLKNAWTFRSKVTRTGSNDTTVTTPEGEQPSITSKWGIGWRTPTLMIITYFMALIFAIAHLLFFRFLDGKEADGPRNVASQSLVVTISNGLAIAFGITLRTSLAFAFCQHLWRLLRQSAMSVSLIEDLFSMRTNPFLLLKLTVLKATPSLCVLVIILLASQVATAFPPGALNVESTQSSSYKMVPIPSFNASFMGNASGVAARANSFTSMSAENPDSYVPGYTLLSVTSNNLINRIARQVLSSGKSLPMVSPCGVNCTYSQVFEGPYFQCNTLSTNTTYEVMGNQNSEVFAAYNGEWNSGIETVGGNPLHKKSYNGTYSLATFNTTTQEPISIEIGTGGFPNTSAIIQQDNTTCIPGRALYTVNNTYTNNVLNTTYNITPLERLVNLALPTHDHVVIVPGIVKPMSSELGTLPANWSATSTAIYRDTNLMAICGAMLAWLNGNYTASLPTPDPELTILGNMTRTSPENPLFWREIPGDTSGGVIFKQGESVAGQTIESTRFNRNYGQFYTGNNLVGSGPLFKVTQEVLNDYLFKVTTSAMLAYGRWNTTANATVVENINVYTFSHPLNLVLPYFITLFISIPFIILGGYALISNGVSATDGGFIQFIATTTGSPALDNAAAGGCLGGSDNVAQELKDLKIRFGELVGRKPGNVKLAGFGTEEEIVPLTKGEKYGIARWI